MTWSPREISRTLDEIKGRSLIDPEFRALALCNPLNAIAKVNPRPLPEGYSVRFVESSDVNKGNVIGDNIIVLPDLLDRIAELTDDDLEDIAGGDSTGPRLRS